MNVTANGPMIPGNQPESGRRNDCGFRTEVEIDRIILYIRADFPHDNWWKKVTVTFSDGEEKSFL